MADMNIIARGMLSPRASGRAFGECGVGVELGGAGEAGELDAGEIDEVEYMPERGSELPLLGEFVVVVDEGAGALVEELFPLAVGISPAARIVLAASITPS
jgi:hypothetical protein